MKFSRNWRRYAASPYWIICIFLIAPFEIISGILRYAGLALLATSRCFKRAPDIIPNVLWHKNVSKWVNKNDN